MENDTMNAAPERIWLIDRFEFSKPVISREAQEGYTEYARSDLAPKPVAGDDLVQKLREYATDLRDPWIRVSREGRENIATKLEQASSRLSERRGEWQGIESAPKDSKARLIWCPERMNVYCACWGTYWNDRDEGRECWMIFGARNTPVGEEPTLWKPTGAPL